MNVFSANVSYYYWISAHFSFLNIYDEDFLYILRELKVY